MPYRTTAWATLALFTPVGLTVAATAPSFTGLGHLDGAQPHSAAGAISPDGSVIVGYDRSTGLSHPFYWTAEGGMRDLFAGTGFSNGNGTGVSSGGSVVVGSTVIGARGQAFRWTEQDGFMLLGGLGTETWSHATGVSADGSVVVGWGFVTGGSFRPFRWTESDGMVALDAVNQWAFSVSGDGNVIVGGGFSWTEADGIRPLDGVAYAASWDGAAIVGWTGDASTPSAVRWTQAGARSLLGNPPEGEFLSEAWAVSGDGSVIVGRGTFQPEIDSTVPSETDSAFIWDASNGMRLLQHVLSDDYGLDLTDWTLSHASSISADGRAIVGAGINPDGRIEAWMAVLPEWLPGDANRDGVVNIADLGILAANWQQQGRFWDDGDFNRDGTVNIADLGILAANWQAGANAGVTFPEAMAAFDTFDGVTIPEPSALAAIALAGLILRRRR
jgi:uncharacterized membrane protein